VVDVVQNLFDTDRQKTFTSEAPDFETATIKMALMAAAYVPDQNLNAYWSDISANEVTGTGYTAGGNVCALGTVTKDAAGLITVDCSDPATWLQNAAGFANAHRAVIYIDTGLPTTSVLVMYSDAFAVDSSSIAGDVTISIGAGGLFTSAR